MKIRHYTTRPVGTEAEAGEVERALDLALARELPAFWVEGFYFTDPATPVQFVICADDDTPDWAWQRLAGFPVGTYKLAESR
jgi:hypothetical protein